MANGAQKRPFSDTTEVASRLASQPEEKRYPKQVYPIKIPLMPCQRLFGTQARVAIWQMRLLDQTFKTGQPLSAFAEVLAAVATFVSRAAEKLRRQGSVAHVLTVFLSKNRYGAEPPPYSCSTTYPLPAATADTAELVRYVQGLLRQLWRPGQTYCKAGVVLDGLEPAGQTQFSLFEQPDPAATEKRASLMAGLDALNRRFGRGTVRVAGFSLQRGEKLR